MVFGNIWITRSKMTKYTIYTNTQNEEEIEIDRAQYKNLKALLNNVQSDTWIELTDTDGYLHLLRKTEIDHIVQTQTDDEEDI